MIEHVRLKLYRAHLFAGAYSVGFRIGLKQELEHTILMLNSVLSGIFSQDRNKYTGYFMLTKDILLEAILVSLF